MEYEYLDDEIKHELKKITNEFGQAEIDWFKAMTFPSTVEVCLDERDEDGLTHRKILRKIELSNLQDLYRVFEELLYPQYIRIKGYESTARIDASENCNYMEKNKDDINIRNNNQNKVEWIKSIKFPLMAEICSDKKENNKQREIIKKIQLTNLADLYETFDKLIYPQYICIKNDNSIVRIDASNSHMEEGEE